jgi:hypothetical protein
MVGEDSRPDSPPPVGISSDDDKLNVVDIFRRSSPGKISQVGLLARGLARFEVEIRFAKISL